ncbi:MAG: HAD family hydrolase [Pseudoramibacter sp.]|jgi:phosphoglycolate phosphatase
MPSTACLPMRHYKAILWDLDGTLMDTGPGIFAAFRHVQKLKGWHEIDDDTLHTLVGPPLVQSYMKTFDLSEEEGIEAAHLHRLYQKQYSYQLSISYPGMDQLLKHLKDRGYFLAVATLKGELIAQKTLEAGHLDQFFDTICGVTPDHVTAKKSDIMQRALEELSLTTHDALLVGDSQYDAFGAWEKTMPFVAVTYGYGFHSTDDAEPWHPLHISDSVDNLHTFLSNI